MHNYKLVLTLILCVIMVLALVACNNVEGKSNKLEQDKVKDEFIDLSSLENNMLYSAVVNLYQTQTENEGAKVRVPGIYIGKDDDNIHYITIDDAQACCNIYVLFDSNGELTEGDKLEVTGTIKLFDRGNGSEFKLINTTIKKL